MQKMLRFALGLSALAGVSLSAREYVLADAATGRNLGDWSLSSAQLGLTRAPAFSIRQRRLHGGRQEGVSIIEVDTGELRFTVVPTRGMNIYRAEAAGVRLGWDSPVTEIVNPAYINLADRGGTGWLEGFNEMLARCGVEWNGHPGLDGGVLLTLHGRTSDTPASTVLLTIDEAPPYRIRLRGRVVEQAFKLADFELWTEISTVPGTRRFEIHDVLTNHSDYEREFELMYHSNFGPPLLELGSGVTAALQRIVPFDPYAAKEIDHWATYRGPTRDFGEQLYLAFPLGDAAGRTAVLLHNRARDRAIQIDFNVRELPCLSIWKNTDTLRQGYVTGLQPGTGFPNSRDVERKFGRVPKLAPGESRTFNLAYTVVIGRAAVGASEQAIASIQAGHAVSIATSPEIADPGWLRPAK